MTLLASAEKTSLRAVNSILPGKQELHAFDHSFRTSYKYIFKNMLHNVKRRRPAGLLVRSTFGIVYRELESGSITPAILGAAFGSFLAAIRAGIVHGSWEGLQEHADEMINDARLIAVRLRQLKIPISQEDLLSHMDKLRTKLKKEPDYIRMKKALLLTKILGAL